MIRPGQLVGTSIGRTVRTLAAGAAGGVLVLCWVRPLLQRFGLGLTALDPLTIAIASIGIVGVGTLAAYIPTSRVYDIDPATLLRE